MIEGRPPVAAPHTPSDDPRVDILAEALRDLAPAWTEERGVRWRGFASDLLARLDAAAPARDDASRGPGHAFTPDGFLDRAELAHRYEHQLRRIRGVYPGDVFARDDGGATARVHVADLAQTYAWIAAVAFQGNDEVESMDAMHVPGAIERDRLGATTNTTPEEGSDD